MRALVLETYTYDDYKQWEGDWELIYGHPYAMAPSPIGKHQFIMMRLGYFLQKNLDELECNKCFVLGKIDYIISNDTVLKPDVALVCGELPKFIQKPPVAIFEIISPSTKLRDETTKKEIYENQGIKLFLIYPDEKKVIYKEKEIKKIEINAPCGKIEFESKDIFKGLN